MSTLKLHDIVLHNGHGNGLRIEEIMGQFAICIPVNKLTDPFKEIYRRTYLLSELVEVMEEVRRREKIRDLSQAN